MDSSDHKSFDQLFKGVVYYTNYHFAEEEALMQKAAYPGLDEHRKLHNHFKEGILAHIQSLQAGKQEDVSLIMDSLKKWLFNHIRKEDMELKKVLNSS